MENKSLTVTIEVAKSPQEIFNCTTKVQQWWSKDFAGNSCQLNDAFAIHHPNQHYSQNKI